MIPSAPFPDHDILLAGSYSARMRRLAAMCCGRLSPGDVEETIVRASTALDMSPHVVLLSLEQVVDAYGAATQMQLVAPVFAHTSTSPTISTVTHENRAERRRRR